MVDSHFHVQLTAVLDVLMKTAVSDICALVESWFKSLHMEIARSKKENEDLRQKLHCIEEERQQPANEAVLESKTTKEEKDDTGSDVKDTEDSGCTVFAGTSAEGLAASAQLWPSSEEDSKKRNCSAIEYAPAITARLRWNHTPVGTKVEIMDKPTVEREDQRLDDTEIKSGCYVLSTELKSESEKSQPEVGSDSEDDSEECVVLDEVCETESPQQRREEEQEFDVSCLWTPDLDSNSTPLFTDNQPGFTNSDCRMTLHLNKDLHRAVADSSVPQFQCEKVDTFICSICGKNLSTKNSLASHYRLHTGEKPFMCAQCGKSFAKKFNLEIHHNIHTGAKPYMCTLCPKSFADPSAFRRHEWIHTRKSQHHTCNIKYKFTCNTCGKCFLSKPSLAAHSQLHTAEKRHRVQKVLF